MDLVQASPLEDEFFASTTEFYNCKRNKLENAEETFYRHVS